MAQQRRIPRLHHLRAQHGGQDLVPVRIAQGRRSLQGTGRVLEGQLALSQGSVQEHS